MGEERGNQVDPGGKGALASESGGPADRQSSIAPAVSEPSNGRGDDPEVDVRVRRVPERARYDRSDIYAVADAGWVAHVGTVRDGLPVVIPTYYVRDGDWLLLHGAPAAGFARRGKGMQVCVTITLLDGLVMAASAFHHSMNYRSLVVLGEACEVTDRDEKLAGLNLLVERAVSGRSEQLRPTSAKEVNGTTLLRVSLEHASVKVRSGGPKDDPDDLELGIWTGVVPIDSRFTSPVSFDDSLDIPAGVSSLEGKSL